METAGRSPRPRIAAFEARHQQRVGAQIIEEVAVGRYPFHPQRAGQQFGQVPFGALGGGHVVAARGQPALGARRGQILAIGLAAGQDREGQAVAPGRREPCKTGGYLQKARVAVRLIGEDSRLRASQRDRALAEFVHGHRGQRAGHHLTDGQQRVQFPPLRLGGQAIGLPDQLVRGPAHRGQHGDYLHAPAPGRHQVPGHRTEPIGIADRSAAEFPHNAPGARGVGTPVTGHGRFRLDQARRRPRALNYSARALHSLMAASTASLPVGPQKWIFMSSRMAAGSIASWFRLNSSRTGVGKSRPCVRRVS